LRKHMEHDDQQDNSTFTARGAWLGLCAYAVLALVMTAIYLFG
jgi:hypothetical protein